MVGTTGLPVPSRAIFYQPHNGFRRLEQFIADPVLKVLYSGTLNTRIQSYQISPLDIQTTIDDGGIHYSLDSKIANSIWLSIVKIAQNINTAGNDYNPWTASKPLPLTIPADSLRAIDMEAPLISVVLTHSDLNPLSKRFVSKDDLISQVNVYQHVANYYTSWMAEAIRRSLALGNLSPWNWGAYFGITWKEFLARATRDEETLAALACAPGLIEEYDMEGIEKSMSFFITPMNDNQLIMKRAPRTRSYFTPYSRRTRRHVSPSRRKYLERKNRRRNF
jgi:hypothetical protein